jgi:hypothetical protein
MQVASVKSQPVPHSSVANNAFIQARKQKTLSEEYVRSRQWLASVTVSMVHARKSGGKQDGPWQE